MKRILIGSNYFFAGREGFSSKDRDYVVIREKGNGYEFIRQISNKGTCTFDVVRRPKNEILEYHLREDIPAMAIGKFLVPEVCSELGITIGDLPVLRPLADRLDRAHEYEKIIYEAYMANGQMTLTDQQKDEAYASYCESRNITVSDKDTTETGKEETDGDQTA